MRPGRRSRSGPIARGAASLNVRMSDKSASQTIQHERSDERPRCRRGARCRSSSSRSSPSATPRAYLDERGLQLEATIEMKDATLGGLVMALGMTTHSHVAGPGPRHRRRVRNRYRQRRAPSSHRRQRALRPLPRPTVEPRHARPPRCDRDARDSGTVARSPGLPAVLLTAVPTPREYERLARAEKNPPHFIEVN